jgi:T5SS/PEP-CTERM-associated repeat protein
VTLEPPGVQESSLFTNPAAFGAISVSEETFNELSTGFHSKSFPFANNPSLGSYNVGQIQKADAFGGAGGTGNYLTVNQSINKASNPTTLTFSNPQRYFGMWWSAGDPNNVLQFYSGATLLETFRTNDVVNFINASPNKKSFYGNPNNGKNTGEPYAFINFYANPSNTGLTFNKIVLSNIGVGTGFESDNHTIATAYVDIAGMDINPATPTDLGAKPGSTDNKGVEGPGSTLTDSGTAVIGGGGTGGLNVIDGGKVMDGSTDIGLKPGSSGDVMVDGKGSSLSDTGNAMIGEGGKGMLDIVGGGTASDTNATVGDKSGSSGTVVVDGKGSNLSDTGNAMIGEGGKGMLDIAGGGTASDTNATVGDKSGSSGTVVVDGSGSQWNNSGALDVGPAGSGVVDITNGGAVSANDGTTLGPKGEIMGNGEITLRR